jgi:aryl-alcohol dehydrogenase-like predicted oxidoreductase
MEYVTLAGTTLRASRIGLGTWAVGGLSWGGSDEAEAIRTIRTAVDRGISLVDTAPVYGFGRSEEILGNALAEGCERGRVILATKGGLRWSDRGALFRDSSPASLRTDLTASLRRLRTDFVDVYQVHWPDPKTPIEETAHALQSFEREGKIRAIGVSNFTPRQMDEFRRIASIHSVQPPYNIFERAAEADVLPYCRANQLSVLAYGAICRGLLSGRMNPERRFSADDIRHADPKFHAPHYRRYLKAVERLDALARARYGKRVIHLALRWLLDQPGVSVALWGARRPEQLAPLADLFGWCTDENTRRDIDAILTAEIGAPIGAEFMAPP